MIEVFFIPVIGDYDIETLFFRNLDDLLRAKDAIEDLQWSRNYSSFKVPDVGTISFFNMDEVQ